MDFSDGAVDFLLDRYLSKHRVDGSSIVNDELSTSASRVVVNHSGDRFRHRITDAHFSKNGLATSKVEDQSRFS